MGLEKEALRRCGGDVPRMFDKWRTSVTYCTTCQLEPPIAPRRGNLAQRTGAENFRGVKLRKLRRVEAFEAWGRGDMCVFTL